MGEDPPGGADSSKPRVHLLSVRGPNPEASFTTLARERTLSFSAEVNPGHRAPSLTWSVVHDPDHAADRVAPSGTPPEGPSSTIDVPAQTTARWRLKHGAPLSARALAFKIVAELPAEGSAPAMRDSAIVQQREIDVLRQEYVDFRIPVPNATDVRSPGDVAGLTRFGWSELNNGDYNVAVLTPVLLTKLNEMDVQFHRTLSLNSVFRNPAHQRFHISVSGGGTPAPRGQHQYGTAVDVRTHHNMDNWIQLHALAKRLGACAEPLDISTSDHVHADWRSGWPNCPTRW